MLFQSLEIIGVTRHEEAAIARLLARQIELRGLGLALHGGGANPVQASAFQSIDLEEDHRAHGDDGQNDDRKGRHQFLFDLQVAQHGVHLTLPP
ncbi:hypothetical protein D3C73_1046220 [compost metagenome]